MISVMEEVSQDDGGAASSDSTGAPIGGNPLQAPNVAAHKGVKSCKGCLYYSSLIKADARNPVCISISMTLPNSGDEGQLGGHACSHQTLPKILFLGFVSWIGSSHGREFVDLACMF